MSSLNPTSLTDFLGLVIFNFSVALLLFVILVLVKLSTLESIATFTSISSFESIAPISFFGASGCKMSFLSATITNYIFLVSVCPVGGGSTSATSSIASIWIPRTWVTEIRTEIRTCVLWICSIVSLAIIWCLRYTSVHAIGLAISIVGKTKRSILINAFCHVLITFWSKTDFNLVCFRLLKSDSHNKRFYDFTFFGFDDYFFTPAFWTSILTLNNWFDIIWKWLNPSAFWEFRTTNKIWLVFLRVSQIGILLTFETFSHNYIVSTRLVHNFILRFLLNLNFPKFAITFNILLECPYPLFFDTFQSIKDRHHLIKSLFGGSLFIKLSSSNHIHFFFHFPSNFTFGQIYLQLLISLDQRST